MNEVVFHSFSMFLLPPYGIKTGKKYYESISWDHPPEKHRQTFRIGI
ncbi:hypothetical protein [Oceanobacillus sp. 1P07AA]